MVGSNGQVLSSVSGNVVCGPAPSNTGPSKSHDGFDGLPDNPYLDMGERWKGGFDTVELSLYGVWDPATFEDTWSRLEAAKVAAASPRIAEDGGSVAPRDRFVNVGGQEFEVLPGTARSSGNGPMYRWRLRALNIELILMKCQEASSAPNVRIKFGSELLMSMGLAWSVAEAARLVGCLGIDVGDFGKALVSRADFALDCLGLQTDELTRLVLADCYVSRPTSQEFFRDGSTFTGVCIGKGNRVRIYDKERETRCDELKRELLKNLRWGGQEIKGTPRIEFQLRREMLVELGVSCVDELFSKRGAVVNYLTLEWFRLTSAAPDRENNHVVRSTLHPIWEAVSVAFERVYGESEVSERMKAVRLPEAKSLKRMIMGCIGSLIAPRVGTARCLSEVLTEIVDEFSELRRFVSCDEEGGRFMAKLDEKVMRFRSLTPLALQVA